MNKRHDVCDRCEGTGHDEGGRPIIKLEKYLRDNGTEGRRHVTIRQGSGCRKCCGTGRVDRD